MIKLKPVAFGNYLKALRHVHGERIYDQSIKLGIAPFQVSEFERGEGEYTNELGKKVVETYGLNRDCARALLSGVELDKLVRASLKSGGK